MLKTPINLITAAGIVIRQGTVQRRHAAAPRTNACQRPSDLPEIPQRTYQGMSLLPSLLGWPLLVIVSNVFMYGNSIVCNVLFFALNDKLSEAFDIDNYIGILTIT